MAKSKREAEIFESCFDRFFSVSDFEETVDQTGDPFRDEDLNDVSQLTEMLLSGDLGGLSSALRESAENANVKNISFFTQKNLFMHRILQGMGVEGLDHDINMYGASKDPLDRQKAQNLQQARDVLTDRVRDFVEKQYQGSRTRTHPIQEVVIAPRRNQ